MPLVAAPTMAESQRTKAAAALLRAENAADETSVALLGGGRISRDVSAGVFWLRVRVERGAHGRAGGDFPSGNRVGTRNRDGNLSHRRIERRSSESGGDLRSGHLR